MEKFKLKDSFVEKYKKIKPSFGFNGLGEITYYRTYSRVKSDGTNEQWFETVERIVNGTYSMQKRHIVSNGLGWEENKAHESAEEMYDRMFNMKFLPAGRGIWTMGSPIIEEKGLTASLNNCTAISTANIDTTFSEPFCFMMDMSMCGSGVSFDTKGAGKIKIKKPIINGFTYIIPDSREGWTKSLQYLIDSYFKGEVLPKFEYHLIRPAGSPIKTFGGIAPGPEPLETLHQNIQHILNPRIGKTLSTTDITDIMNLIGVCVVSGNLRRTAQLALGDQSDKEFMSLKDYSRDGEKYIGPMAHRGNYGWASNNTVTCKIGQDYKELSDLTIKNGEPGYLWLENAQNYGRMNGIKESFNKRAIIPNPCGEILLESGEQCNLVELFPINATDLDDFLRTIKFAYLYGKTVTLGKSHWTITNKVQMRNRRIGVSVGGVAQFIGEHGINILKEYLVEGYKTINYYDDIYSEWMAIPKSVAKTAIKPSGSISLLTGATPGVHYPLSNYYIRRIKVSVHSELIPYIQKAGYNTVPDITEPDNTLIVEVPVKIENCRTLGDISIWEQLELAAFMQEHWADNQVSCTVTFRPEEASQIERALQYFQYRLKSISFLPLDNSVYTQMPYESISKEKYENLVKQLKGLSIKTLSEKAEPEKFCDGDTCTM